MPSLVATTVSLLVRAAVALGLAVLTLRWSAYLLRRLVFKLKRHDKLTVAFMHPHADAGGGGERVLWAAIASLASLHDHSKLRVVIYIRRGAKSGPLLLSEVEQRFGIRLPPLEIVFVPLSYTWLLEAATWPRFTMLGQSLGAIPLTLEALRACSPDVFVDTTGLPFSYPLAKLGVACYVVAYIHYPTITADMLQRVWEKRPTYNNDERIASSQSATVIKLIYYRLFAALYCMTGGFVDSVLVNSTWTKNHITQMWRLPLVPTEAPAAQALTDARGETNTTLRQRRAGSTSNPVPAETEPTVATNKPQYDTFRPVTGGLLSVARALTLASHLHECVHSALALLQKRDASGEDSASLYVPDISRPAALTVYPPCNTSALSSLPIHGKRDRLVVSLAQFRPEKDHALQLAAFAEFRRRGGAAVSDVRLVLIGGVRNDEDQRRVDDLKMQAARLGLEAPSLEFKINASLDEVRSLLGSATCGLHTMWNEHFGIGVVEMQAAGVIPISHYSGGPKSDIVRLWPSLDAVEPTIGRQDAPATVSSGDEPLPSASSGASETQRDLDAAAGTKAADTRTGFLCTTAGDYAEALLQVFRLNPTELEAIRRAARLAAGGRFSDEAFSLDFFAAVLRPIKMAMLSKV